MTTVASGRSRDAAQSIAKQYERRGYTVKIEDEYHPHGPGRAFKVVTMEDVPRGTGAKSADPLTPDEAAHVFDLLESQKHAEPGEKHAVALAISEAIYRPKKKPDVDVKIVRDKDNKIIDVIAPTYLKPFHSGSTGKIIYPVVAARKEYEKTGGEIPGYVQEQLSLSPEMKEIGISEQEYETKAFETSLGYSTEQQYQDWYTGKLIEHHDISGGRIPSFVDTIVIPESVKAIGAGTEYSRLSYEMGLGIKSESKASEELQSIISGKVSALPDPLESQWYMKYGGPEGTGVILKPDEILKIQDKQPVIVTKPPEPVKERSVWDIGDWWEDPIGTLGGGVADVFSLERMQYVHASLTQPLHEIKPKLIQESEGMREIREYGRGEWRRIWETGDIGGGAARIIGSPLVIGPISFGAGAMATGGFAAIAGSGAPSAVTFSTYGPWVAGGTLSGVIGADIGITAAKEEHGLIPEGTTAGKVGMLGVAYYGAYLGSVYAMQPSTKLAASRFSSETKAYVQRHIPKYEEIVKFKHMGMYAKRPGLGLRAEAYRQLPFYRKIDYQIKDFVKTSQIQKSILAYRKGLSYYGQELYPSAVKTGLVKDVGLFKSSEILPPYSYYDTASWHTRPENIRIMPHDTRTEFYVTEKGTIEFTSSRVPAKGMMRFGEATPDVWSSGEIFPEYEKGFVSSQFGTGKKGGSLYDFLTKTSDTGFYVSGRTYYKVYGDKGPLATIPSIRENAFYGFVTQKELKLPYGSSLSSDWTISKMTGSFKAGPVSSSKALVIHDPNKIYKFQNRLIEETLYSESFGVTKSFEGGTVTKPGRYGLESIETPRVSLSYTKTYIPAQSKDFAITRFPMPKTGSKMFTGGSGFDYSTPGIVTKGDLILPGGISKFPGGLKYPTPEYMKIQHPSLSSRVSLSYLESLESGTGYVSSFWKNVIPVQSAAISSVVRVDVKSLGDIVSTGVSPVSIQKINFDIRKKYHSIVSPVVKVDVISGLKSKSLPVQGTKIDVRTVTLQKLVPITPSVTIPSVKIFTPRSPIPETPITPIKPIIPVVPLLPLLGNLEKDIEVLVSGKRKRKKAGARKRTHPVRLFDFPKKRRLI